MPLHVTKSSITESKTSNSLKPVSQSPISDLSVLSLACTTFPLTVPCNHQLPRSVPIVTISVIIARVIAVAIFIIFDIVRSVRMMLDLLVVDVLQSIGATYRTILPMGTAMMVIVLCGLALGGKCRGEVGTGRKRATRCN